MKKVIKQLAASDLEIKSIDEGTRTIWHRISREVKDRMGDIVRLAGGDFSDFAKKPAVLYGHDYTGKTPISVIAENVGFKIEGDALWAGTRFLDTGVPGMSQALRDLVNDNWILHKQKLLGWSVGFLPTEAPEAIKDDKGQIIGYDFKKWSLLEYSSVVIPAHQDAINDCLRKGILSESFLNTLPEDMKTAAVGIVGEEPKTAPEPPADKPTEPAPSEPEPLPKAKEPEATEPPAPEPEQIDKTQPKTRPKSNTGEKHMDKIFEKLLKGEELTAEEKDLLAKFQIAFGVKAPEPAAPARKLDLVDADLRGNKTRHMTEIVRLPSRFLTDEEKELRRFADDAYIIGTLLKTSPVKLKFWQDRYGLGSALRKAMDTATATEGAEWVPTLLSADYIERFRLQAKVAALFDDIPMPSNPFKLPYAGGLSASNFYLVGQSISDSPTASPASTMATGDKTLTSQKLKARLLFSDELSEDSIIAVLPMLRNELGKGGAEAIEDVILNGDTTAVHMDSDVTDSKDRRKAWDGLRDQCPAGTKVDLGTFTYATFMTIVTAMGKYGINPTDLAIITGAVGYNKLRNLAEVTTVDKYGPSATIHNGELGKLAGAPIIVSEYIRETLNATGVYDATTMTKTVAVIVNRRCPILGTRGGVKLRFEEEGAVDQNQLTMSFRKAMQYRWTPSASITTIGLAYNIA